jgi:hypothetical protein
MIETILKTSQVLSFVSLTVQDVVKELGNLTQDPGGDAGLIIQPTDKDFRTALVGRRIHSQEPAFVQLSMADPYRLTVEALHKTFGVWSELPNINWNLLQEIIFYVDLPGMSKTCAVIACVEPGEQGLEDGFVVKLTVRRDNRA